MRILYIIATYLVLPIVFIHMLFKSFNDVTYLQRIGERFGYYKGEKPQNILWVHAVSYGEVKAAIPLINKLRINFPQKRVLITTTTPSGSRLVKELFGNKVDHVYLPYDTKGSVIRFFKYFNPEIAIIIETELWPNIFHYCGVYKVPLVLASACVSDRSISLYRVLFKLFQKTVSEGIVIGAQTQEDAEKFISLGSDTHKIKVTGNIKFDIEIPSESVEEAKELKESYFQDRTIWVAGSTHEGEEEVVLEAHRLVLKDNPNALLVIAPRNPDRFTAVKKIIKHKKFNFHSWSEGLNNLDNKEILLLDSLGQLNLFYSIANASFVGGSLFSVGGHNLLEPASLKTPIITGPCINNIKDISQKLKQNNALVIVKGSLELAKSINQITQNKEKSDKMILGGLKVIEENKGSTEKIFELIKPLIDRNLF